MSTWMSIGFHPDQMDLTTEPTTQAVISGARDDATPRPTAGLDQATLERVRRRQRPERLEQALDRGNHQAPGRTSPNAGVPEWKL